MTARAKRRCGPLKACVTGDAFRTSLEPLGDKAEGAPGTWAPGGAAGRLARPSRSLAGHERGDAGLPGASRRETEYARTARYRRTQSHPALWAGAGPRGRLAPGHRRHRPGWRACPAPLLSGGGRGRGTGCGELGAGRSPAAPTPRACGTCAPSPFPSRRPPRSPRNGEVPPAAPAAPGSAYRGLSAWPRQPSSCRIPSPDAGSGSRRGMLSATCSSARSQALSSLSFFTNFIERARARVCVYGPCRKEC